MVAIYRSNDSTAVTGPFDKELISALPSKLEYICHNGAGYDNIDVPAATERNIQISSTPIAVDEATADSMFLLKLLALLTLLMLSSRPLPPPRRPPKNHNPLPQRPQRRLARQKLRPRPRPQEQSSRNSRNGRNWHSSCEKS